MKLILLTALFVLLQTPAPIPGQTSENQSSDSKSVKENANHNKNITAPAPIPNTGTAVDAKGNATEEATINEQEHVIVEKLPGKDMWDKTYIVLTGILVLIGAITLIALWYQARETARAARAAEVSAKAAEANIELVISKERARLRVHHPSDLAIFPDPKPEEFNPSNAILYRIENLGPTKAFIVDYRILAMRTEAAEISLDSDDVVYGRRLPSVFAADCEMLFTSSLNPPEVLSEREVRRIIDDIVNGRSFVHFNGFIKYRDIFGNDRKTTFSLRWQTVVVGEDGASLTPGAWVKTGKEADNEEA